MTPGQLTAKAGLTRPRIADEREAEILDAAVRVLAKVGYDRLTMDQVAAEARASKASLYRHWSSKAELVVDAISKAKGMPESPPDTGSLRGDLMATWCGKYSNHSTLPVSVMNGLMSAMHADEELAAAFRERLVGPRMAAWRVVAERAQERGEIAPGVDHQFVLALLPAMCSYFGTMQGRHLDDEFVTRIIDEVVVPVAQRTASQERGSGEPIS
jgi:AcrR family transcriptional regulator